MTSRTPDKSDTEWRTVARTTPKSKTPRQYNKPKNRNTAPSKTHYSEFSKEELEKWKSMSDYPAKKIHELIPTIEEKKRKHIAVIIFHEACKRDAIPGSHVEDLLQVLLDFKLFSINEKNPVKHATALHNAAYNGCANTVKFLLDRGADTLLLNTKCGGETPLQSAELGKSQCKSTNAETYANYDKCIELLKTSCLSVQVSTPSSKKLDRKSSQDGSSSKIEDSPKREEKALLSPLSPEMSPMIKSLGAGSLFLDEETPHKRRSLSAGDELSSPLLLKTLSAEKSPDSKDTALPSPTRWRTSIGISSPAEKARRKFRSILNILNIDKLDILMTEILEIKIDPFDTKLQQDFIDIYISNIQQSGKKGVEEHYQTSAQLTVRIYNEWSQGFLAQLIAKLMSYFEQPIDKEDEKQTKNIQHLAMFVGYLYQINGCSAKVIHDVITIYLSGTHTQFGTNIVCHILKLTGAKMLEKNDPKLKEYVSKLTLLKPNFTKQTMFAIEDVIQIIGEKQ